MNKLYVVVLASAARFEAPLVQCTQATCPDVVLIRADQRSELEQAIERFAPIGLITTLRPWGEPIADLLASKGEQIAGFVVLEDQIEMPQRLSAREGFVDMVAIADVQRLHRAMRHLCANVHAAHLLVKSERLGELAEVIQRLSMANSMTEIMASVRSAARRLTGAHGASFLLREENHCFYADEDAISPLWKGQRFPINSCVGGYAMLERSPVLIEDVYQDERIPLPAYELTFVRSLAMVPIRAAEPIGAIGVYWAWKRQPSQEDVELLQALANATSLAIENASAQHALEQRVARRTEQLQAANEQLEAFSSSVSHDLRNRLNAVLGFCTLLELRLEESLDGTSREQFARLREAALQMTRTIADLLTLSRSGRKELQRQSVDLSQLANRVAADMSGSGLFSPTRVEVQAGMHAWADPGLLHIVLDNLMSNAFKYSSKQAAPAVNVGVSGVVGEEEVEFFVRDNGVGFDQQAGAAKLFKPFARLHSEEQFPGTGLGLTIVRRIVERHGGQVRGESQPGNGTTFYFSLPSQRRGPPSHPLDSPVEGSSPTASIASVAGLRVSS